MDPKLRHQWITFLDGDWQKEMPQEEGIYPVASRTAADCGESSSPAQIDVIFLCGDKLVSYKKSQGWWWSVPLPDMPQPPKWREED